jgi:hypothetical protein
MRPRAVEFWSIIRRSSTGSERTLMRRQDAAANKTASCAMLNRKALEQEGDPMRSRGKGSEWANRRAIV